MLLVELCSHVKIVPEMKRDVEPYSLAQHYTTPDSEVVVIPELCAINHQ